jgi:hypothetical protein
MRELLPVLLKSRWAAWTCVAVALMLGQLELYLFFHETQARTDIFGSLFRDERGSWVLMAGRLVRAFFASWLILWTLNYLRQLRSLQDRADADLEPLFNSISRGVRAMGWCCVVVMCYVLTFLIDYNYGLPSIPLGPRHSEFQLAERETNGVKIELHEAHFKEVEGWIARSIRKKQTVEEVVYLNRVPIVASEDIIEARPVADENGLPALTLRFSEAGAQKLSAATANMIDKPMAIMIDDVLLSVHTIRSILGESVMVTGDFTEDRVREIADSVNGKPGKK